MARDCGIYLVAECGVAWDSKSRLKRLIKDVLEAGADAVKLQLFSAETIKDYPVGLRERLTSMMLQLGDLNEISVFTHANGGELIVTPMYLGAMDLLAKMRPFPCDGFKVRAKDFTNLPVLKEVITKAGGMPVYVSVPHDAEGNIPATVPEVWPTVFSTNVYQVYCRPEYPPKLNTLNLYKSLGSDGISLHSNDWTVHAIACAFHIGREEARPHEHIKRFYCEVHVQPSELISVVGETTYDRPLDAEVSLTPAQLAELSRAIKTMEVAIG
jgi:sialic acid synthase SpsE